MVKANVSGVPVETPETYATRVPAEVLVASVARTERLFASQVQTAIAYLVTLHFRSDVRRNDRLVWHHPRWGDRLLYVTGLTNPDGRLVDLVLACSEVA